MGHLFLREPHYAGRSSPSSLPVPLYAGSRSHGTHAPEVEGLRSYLLAGGFLFIDDFWDTNEWANFEREIRQVLPITISWRSRKIT